MCIAQVQHNSVHFKYQSEQVKIWKTGKCR